MKPVARVYLPRVSVLTLAAASAFVLFGLVLVVWLWVALHPLAALVAGVVMSGVAYMAAESHAASQRYPDEVDPAAGPVGAEMSRPRGFTDPEDQDDAGGWA